MSTPLVIFVTFPSIEVGRAISRALVESGLAACVNLLPGAESVYRWQGRLEVSSEVVGLIKTTAAKADALRVRYMQLHPYQVAEFLEIACTGGTPKYLEWLVGCVERGSEES